MKNSRALVASVLVVDSFLYVQTTVMIRPATLSAISFPRVSLPRAFVDKRSSDQIYLNNRSWIECAMVENKECAPSQANWVGPPIRIRVITALSVSAAKNGTRRVGMQGGKIECYRIEGSVATTRAAVKTKEDGEDLQVGGRRGNNNNDSQGSPL